ncbi:MAG: universal stress protein [Gemmatimonadota bacterium]
MYSRIMVPLDGSAFAEAALPYALALAGRWRAAVELVTVNDAESGGGGRSMAEGPAERQMGAEYLASMLERIRTSGYRGKFESALVTGGEVVPRLVERLRNSAADFVVMTTHGRGPVRRAWLGSRADGFLRCTPVPVLLIRPTGEDAATGEDAVPGDEPSRTDLSHLPPPFKRVLLPLDGSPEAERLLEIAAPLASGSDTEVLLLRAVPPFIPCGSPYVPHVVRGAEEETMVTAAAQEYLDALATRVPVGRVVTRVTTIGQPALAILDVAEEEGADLIAMSTAGRGGVSRMLLGSVADKVIRGSAVPVLLYRYAPEA